MTFSEYIDLNDTLLEVIKKEGAALTPPEQIAVKIDIPEDIFLTMVTTSNHPARVAYLTGLTSTETKLRETALESAMAGSPAAMEQALSFLKVAKHKL